MLVIATDDLKGTIAGSSDPVAAAFDSPMNENPYLPPGNQDLGDPEPEPKSPRSIADKLVSLVWAAYALMGIGLAIMLVREFLRRL